MGVPFGTGFPLQSFCPSEQKGFPLQSLTQGALQDVNINLFM